MMNLFSVCDLLVWPWLLLWWLLPFLLGLLLGYLIWGSYRRKWEDEQRTSAQHRNTISRLEADLEECRKRRSRIENDLTLLRAEMRELKKAPPSVRTQIASTPPVVPTPAPAPTPKADDNIYAALKSDQLQVVEGIGPKMESVLKEKGIGNWGDLSGQSPTQLRALLDTYGSKYKIIDPITWPEQAGLAHKGDWQGLIARQKELSGGTMEVQNATDSKVEKMLIKMGVLKKFKPNDLKAVEGIGPKIEKLLQNDGIDTWLKLSESTTSRLQEILTKAGDRYKLADPTTWPKQAEYAANGQWKELQEYQDFLQGGREA